MRTSLLTRSAALLLVLGLLGITAAAQDAPVDSTRIWKKTLTADLVATQTAYSDSWTGGEAGSFSWVSKVNGLAERNLNDWFNLRSQLKLAFGQTNSQDEETKNWSKPTKSTDLIDWETVGRFLLQRFVDPYAAFRLESQFYDGSGVAFVDGVDTTIVTKKRYLSPLRLTESAGIARRFWERDKDQLTSRLGFAFRETFTSVIIDVEGNTETNTQTDGGLESVTDVLYTFNERLQYTGKLTLFRALFFSDKDDFAGTPYEDDWKAIDANWENIVTAQLTKVIAVNFYTQILYDKQIVDKARFKETLGIGFLFKLM